MTRVCAWCQMFMGEKAPLEDRRITHGICPRCNAVQIASLHEQLTELARANPSLAGQLHQDNAVSSNAMAPDS